MTQTLPALNPFPDDIEEHIQRLLQAPPDPATGDWLLELIKASGHMSTGDDMRWRLLCIVWLSMVYNPDDGWPYLQWLNMGEPAISSHLSDMLIEALDNYSGHVQMANWQVNTQDERLQTFFNDFHPIPALRKMQPLMTGLFADPTRPEVGVWLATFCEGTTYNDVNYFRLWRLLAAAWYAAGFNASKGLEYLHTLTGKAVTLSAADNGLLMDAADKTNGTAALILLIADCSDPAVREMLKEFGHPDLPAVANSILQSKPHYAHLSGTAEHAATDVALFKQTLQIIEQAGITPKRGTLLNLACGPLAEQALLFGSTGYKVLGLGLEVPPDYLPLAGATQWLKRRKHTSAWKEATADYYKALVQLTGLKLKWNNVDIKLADLTRLEEADNSFEAIICTNHLHHAPDVNSLLAEAARVLKPGGIFVANIRPYTGFIGAFQVDPQAPWAHLRSDVPFEPVAALPLNKWRASQFRAALDVHFAVEQWQVDVDVQAQQLLIPDIRAQLADYTDEELTCTQILAVAVKGNK